MSNTQAAASLCACKGAAVEIVTMTVPNTGTGTGGSGNEGANGSEGSSGNESGSEGGGANGGTGTSEPVTNGVSGTKASPSGGVDSMYSQCPCLRSQSPLPTVEQGAAVTNTVTLGLLVLLSVGKIFGLL